MNRLCFALAVLVVAALAARGSRAHTTTGVEAAARTLTPAAVSAAQDAPVCKKCQSTGRQPCPEHDKDECAFEDDALFCSVVAGCAVCSGVGFVPCPDCKNEPARAKIEARKAQIATKKVALEYLDTTMGRPLRKAESEHFVLVWEMERLKVDKKWLDGHRAMHLYLNRLEKVHPDYLARMQITDKEFLEKFRVFVWQFPQDHADGGLRFCKQAAKGGVKLMGNTPSYSVCGNKQNFQDDEKLHRNIVHCVVHLMLSAQKPVAWIGNLKAGWYDEGLAHFFEDRYWGICDTYCYQEANSNVDFKGGRFRLAVRTMVTENKCPPIAEVFEQNVDTLTLPMHAVAFSYVECLINRDGAKFSELGKKLKAKVPTREALKEIYGFTPMEFEGLWKAWVLATYPTK